jgi:hypothetical protein
MFEWRKPMKPIPKLERAPGTGPHKEKRPDFRHQHTSGPLYFEVKALQIAEH